MTTQLESNTVLADTINTLEAKLSHMASEVSDSADLRELLACANYCAKSREHLANVASSASLNVRLNGFLDQLTPMVTQMVTEVVNKSAEKGRPGSAPARALSMEGVEEWRAIVRLIVDAGSPKTIAAFRAFVHSQTEESSGQLGELLGADIGAKKTLEFVQLTGDAYVSNVVPIK